VKLNAKNERALRRRGFLSGLACASARLGCADCGGACGGLAGYPDGPAPAPSESVSSSSASAAAAWLLASIGDAINGGVSDAQDERLNADAPIAAITDPIIHDYMQAISEAIHNELDLLDRPPATGETWDSDPDIQASIASLRRMRGQLTSYQAGTLDAFTLAHAGQTKEEHAAAKAKHDAIQADIAKQHAAFCASPTNMVVQPELWKDYGCKSPLPDFDKVLKYAKWGGAALGALVVFVIGRKVVKTGKAVKDLVAG
jgi:hypothetical protein